jgi:hypothetical protein
MLCFADSIVQIEVEMNQEQFVNMFGAEPGASLFLDAPGGKRALDDVPRDTKKDTRKKGKKETVQVDEASWAAVRGGFEKEALGMIKLLSGFDAQLSADDAATLPIQAHGLMIACCELWMGLCTGCLHACFCCRSPLELSRRACVSSKTQWRASARMLFQDCVSAWRELAGSSCRQQCF